jgi:hypothetical protein
MKQCGELPAPIRAFREALQVRLIISNGLTALGTGFLVPGMCCVTILATPPLILYFQPIRKAFFPDQLHVP